MYTFEQYIKKEFDIDMPKGEISGTWFHDNGLPMVVECCRCGMTMASPSALIDFDGHCYCLSCGGDD